MAADATLDEIVLFELPGRDFAERLLARLALKRLAWLQSDDDGTPIVGVLLNPDRLDLALLLRDVQAWLARSYLAGIRFEVDRRVYALEARQPLLAAG